jgi:hypothetical protein
VGGCVLQFALDGHRSNQVDDFCGSKGYPLRVLAEAYQQASKPLEPTWMALDTASSAILHSVSNAPTRPLAMTTPNFRPEAVGWDHVVPHSLTRPNQAVVISRSAKDPCFVLVGLDRRLELSA